METFEIILITYFVMWLFGLVNTYWAYWLEDEKPNLKLVDYLVMPLCCILFLWNICKAFHLTELNLIRDGATPTQEEKLTTLITDYDGVLK